MRRIVTPHRARGLALAAVCAAALSACLGEVGTLPLEPAQLSFANDGKASGLAGWFHSVDGEALAGKPATVSLKPGSRVIGYYCPDTITLDRPPTITHVFAPDESYVLECDADSARIRETRE